MSEEEKTEETAQTEEQTKEWDAERQRIDHAEANVRKLSEQLSSVTQEKTAMQSRLEALERAISSKTDEISLADIDEDLVGSGVKQNQQVLCNEIKALKAKHAALEAKAANYEEQQTRDKEKAAQQARKEKICKPLNDKYGKKYEVAAEKLAREKVDKGDADMPTDALEARDLMAICYKELHEQDEQKAKKTIPTDTGEGGFIFDQKTVKTGSREEVLAEMKKRK